MHGEPTEGERGSHKNTLEAARNGEGGQASTHEAGAEVKAFLEAGPTRPASVLHTQGEGKHDFCARGARETQ